MKFRVPALLAGLLLGCQATAPVALRDHPGTDELKTPGDALVVSLRVMVPTDNGERQLAEDETLSNRDPFSLVVRASKPAYLYVVHLGADGAVRVLFPTAAYQQVPASCPVRLPERKPLYLQGPAGTEDLHVVATLRPLAEVDSRLCEELHLPCDALNAATPPQTAPCSPIALPKVPQLPPPPPRSDSVFTKRAIFPNVKVGQAQSLGVATVSFSVRHVR